MSDSHEAQCCADLLAAKERIAAFEQCLSGPNGCRGPWVRTDDAAKNVYRLKCGVCGQGKGGGFIDYAVYLASDEYKVFRARMDEEEDCDCDCCLHE